MKADSCILEIIGENNPEHFFVATQDTDLRRKLLEVSNIPPIVDFTCKVGHAVTSRTGRRHMVDEDLLLLKASILCTAPF